MAKLLCIIDAEDRPIVDGPALRSGLPDLIGEHVWWTREERRHEVAHYTDVTGSRHAAFFDAFHTMKAAKAATDADAGLVLPSIPAGPA